MSPRASAATKVSPCFSAKRRRGAGDDSRGKSGGVSGGFSTLSGGSMATSGVIRESPRLGHSGGEGSAFCQGMCRYGQAGKLAQLPLVNLHVLLGHGGGGKAPLKHFADAPAIQRSDLAQSLVGLLIGVDYESRHAMVDDFRYRAAVPGNDRRSARHGLDHHHSERFRPSDRKQQGIGIPQE